MEDGFEAVDTVLIVDQDVNVRATLRELALKAQNFRVIEAQDGPAALGVFLRAQPNLVILALELPGLSGRDLLVALKSQGYRGPLIVLAEKDSAHTPIEALRLGAMDFIIKPFREAEVLAAIERCMSSIRLRRQRAALVKQLETANQELETRLKQLAALYEVGEVATALEGVDALARHVLENAVALTEADYAMLLLRDETSGELVLSAGQNLPISIADRQGEHAADELADLVMTTRETLVADTDTLRRFSTEKGLYAAIYAPLVVQTAALGVLVVGNHQCRVNFTDSHEQLIRGLANYLSMAVVSMRLSKLLEKRSNAMKAAYHELRERDAQRTQQLRAILASLQRPLVVIEVELIRLSRQLASGQNPRETSQGLIALSKQVRQMITHVTSLEQHSDHVLSTPPANPPQSMPVITTEE
ncbi:MAG: response regulator [Anaerolineae bacterium]|nr:response regulator [Anaerolineae bacterium]